MPEGGKYVLGENEKITKLIFRTRLKLKSYLMLSKSTTVGSMDKSLSLILKTFNLCFKKSK